MFVYVIVSGDCYRVAVSDRVLCSYDPLEILRICLDTQFTKKPEIAYEKAEKLYKLHNAEALKIFWVKDSWKTLLEKATAKAKKLMPAYDPVVNTIGSGIFLDAWVARGEFYKRVKENTCGYTVCKECFLCNHQKDTKFNKNFYYKKWDEVNT